MHRTNSIKISLSILVVICAVMAASTQNGKPNRALLLQPDSPEMNKRAPDSARVRLETTKGVIRLEMKREWAPIGVDRFYTLVQTKYFDDVRFFRVVKGFVAQFGMSGEPKVTQDWQRRCIADEPVHHSNSRGTISFARGGPGTRSVQLFVNLADNPVLDSLSGFGFPPIGEVVSGMDVVDSLYSGYGDAAPRSGPQYGREGPDQDSIGARGNAYLNAGWPKLDYIKTARVVQAWPPR